MKSVYIVAARRSALAKAKKGSFANVRPDDLLAHIIKHTVAESKVNPADIGDVVIGCAFPEAEQGQNIARVAALLAGLPDSVPGMTINRYCSSGVNSIAIAANRIQAGEIEVAVAGGVESMSLIPMGGNDYSISPEVFAKDENTAIAYGMGITAENVASQWQISREDQDAFSVESHKKAALAQAAGYFNEEIIPYELIRKVPDLKTNQIKQTSKQINTDEGIRADTTQEGLAKLKPAFAAKGSVTAGNSSQMTDGAAVLVLVSEDYLKKNNLTPLARFVNFAVAGVPAAIMGIGPVKAIPQSLGNAGLSLGQIDWIELNEAFAAQSLAVIRDLKLDANKVNPYGGAIALGHPLGATGAVLATRVIHGLRRNKLRYGMVTMCIGTGMGAAAIFEAL
ncbi:acetyl-CoA C-acyltransferase [Aquella oligotrophica]|uniref:acetyl-CoA C-acyltransferase n=1 Tax=Aquella oligotrophica TaxID=2067065 RepID=A0A2I7N8K2_9NEIS|nr:acetyl-CoA C-acyltransferase [Aquella oligotrophica]AUR52771.1 acetyl-CoA C-acyltransferase [Aquella oligotrophica]